MELPLILDNKLILDLFQVIQRHDDVLDVSSLRVIDLAISYYFDQAVRFVRYSSQCVENLNGDLRNRKVARCFHLS